MRIQNISNLVSNAIYDGNDSEWDEFVCCCKFAFPTVIDEAYVELANQFFNYIYLSHKLIECGYVLDRNAVDMNALRTSIEELSQDERHVLESFRRLFDYYKNEENLPSDIWKTFQDMINSGVEISSERESKEFSLKNDMRKYMDNTLDASRQQELIRESIVSIQRSLDTIDSLDIDEAKRIDRVKVTQKHFDRIDGILNLSADQKEMLKEMLVSYVDLRVESFKVVEDLSRKAIDSYHHRELLDVWHLELELYDKYNVAACGLALSDSFFANSAGIMEPVSYHMLQDNFCAEMTVMNMAANYLKYGAVHGLQLDNLSSKIIKSATSDTLLALENTKEIREERVREDQSLQFSSIFENSSVTENPVFFKK